MASARSVRARLDNHAEECTVRPSFAAHSGPTPAACDASDRSGRLHNAHRPARVTAATLRTSAPPGTASAANNAP